MDYRMKKISFPNQNGQPTQPLHQNEQMHWKSSADLKLYRSPNFRFLDLQDNAEDKGDMDLTIVLTP